MFWKRTLLAVVEVDNIITVCIIYSISHFVAVVRIMRKKEQEEKALVFSISI